MFGDFAAAAAFHEATCTAQAHHVQTLLEHRETFGAVSRGADVAATSFTEMEADNAATIRAVWCTSAT